ncbi:MAG TPA: sigma-70 family RNA polymerase sigma factor [Thermoflexia bacterium]|nr:sigma-70 family RNA polymerase sigma factor [Thermoflexia bacterium]
MSAEDERALIEQAQNDPQAFGELYRQYVQRIYNYHYRHTGNRADAEDLTSQTFQRALRYLRKYRQRGTFQAWLFKIAHNLMANHHRDRGRHPQVTMDAVASLESAWGKPDEGLSSREEEAHLLRVIGALPAERRTLIILKFVEGFSNAEIAEVLGRTEGAIKALYYRTLQYLREIMVEVESNEA